MIHVNAPSRSLEDLLAAVGLAGHAETYAVQTGLLPPRCWFTADLTFVIDIDEEPFFDWLCSDDFKHPCYLIPAIKDSPQPTNTKTQTIFETLQWPADEMRQLWQAFENQGKPLTSYESAIDTNIAGTKKETWVAVDGYIPAMKAVAKQHQIYDKPLQQAIEDMETFGLANRCGKGANSPITNGGSSGRSALSQTYVKNAVLIREANYEQRKSDLRSFISNNSETSKYESSLGSSFSSIRYGFETVENPGSWWRKCLAMHGLTLYAASPRNATRVRDAADAISTHVYPWSYKDNGITHPWDTTNTSRRTWYVFPFWAESAALTFTTAKQALFTPPTKPATSLGNLVTHATNHFAESDLLGFSQWQLIRGILDGPNTHSAMSVTPVTMQGFQLVQGTPLELGDIQTLRTQALAALSNAPHLLKQMQYPKWIDRPDPTDEDATNEWHRQREVANSRVAERYLRQFADRSNEFIVAASAYASGNKNHTFIQYLSDQGQALNGASMERLLTGRYYSLTKAVAGGAIHAKGILRLPIETAIAVTDGNINWTKLADLLISLLWVNPFTIRNFWYQNELWKYDGPNQITFTEKLAKWPTAGPLLHIVKPRPQEHPRYAAAQTK